MPSSSSAVCKLCGRSKESEQPLNHLKERYPTLQWRRAQGRECAICPMVIAVDRELNKISKAELEQQLTRPLALSE